MKRIKIAQVITRMDWGGSPDVLRVLCRRLDPAVYDLRVIIGLTGYPTDKTKLFFNDFKDKIIFIPELKREVSLVSDWRAIRKLWKVFREEKFDIVHTHTAKAGALGRLAAKLAGVPAIIHTSHGHNFYGYFNVFFSRAVIIIERILSFFTDRIIVLTKLEKRDCLSFKVAKARKIALVYMGLELDSFQAGNPDKIRVELDIQSREKVVGYVGRLDAIKGPQFFVNAARLCLQKNNSLKFILVGEGVLRKELEEKVASWGLQNRIIFTGWRDDIPTIMSIMDVLILPSLNEAVGIVLIEAQSLGVPVVASNVGGIPEIIKDKQTGILVEPANPHLLAGAVIELLNNPSRMKAMSEAAKNRVRGRFKAESMVEKITGIYSEVLKEKNLGDSAPRS